MRLRQMRNNADNVHMANYAAENLIHIYPHTEGKNASFMRCFGSNVVKNIVVDVFFKTSLKHRIVKQKVRCFTRCFRFQKALAHNAKNG